MPQMAPMYWLTLLFFFLFIFMMFLMLSYFLKPYKPFSTSSLKVFIPTSFWKL